MKNLNTKELRAIARDLGVNNWWNLKKDQLIEQIEAVKTVDVIVPDEPENDEAEENINPLTEQENVPEDHHASQRKNHKRLIEYNGKTQTLTAWAKELGIRHQTLYNRIVMKGWDVDRAFEKPTKKEVHADAETVTGE